MRTILIVSAAVTWAHEEIRLREPANRASKMRAINGEDLEILTIDISNPAGEYLQFLHPKDSPLDFDT